MHTFFTLGDPLRIFWHLKPCFLNFLMNKWKIIFSDLIDVSTNSSFFHYSFCLNFLSFSAHLPSLWRSTNQRQCRWGAGVPQLVSIYCFSHRLEPPPPQLPKAMCRG